MNAVKVLYKPVGLALGVAAGAVAGAVFDRTWQALGHTDEAPDATDEERGWGEVLVAAAVHGALFAVTKAAVARSGAAATRKVTGTWPA